MEEKIETLKALGIKIESPPTYVITGKTRTVEGILDTFKLYFPVEGVAEEDKDLFDIIILHGKAIPVKKSIELATLKGRMKARESSKGGAKGEAEEEWIPPDLEPIPEFVYIPKKGQTRLF